MLKRNRTSDSSGPKNRKMRSLVWLGGPALFGFVSCQSPESAEAPEGKTQDTLEVVRQPPVVGGIENLPAAVVGDTVPIAAPTAFFHAGQACDTLQGPKLVCSLEGELLACEAGVMGEPSVDHFGTAQANTSFICHPGSPTAIPIFTTMGFNGSDAADRSLPRPRAFVRGPAKPGHA
jgi:hypothetical protein